MPAISIFVYLFLNLLPKHKSEYIACTVLQRQQAVDQDTRARCLPLSETLFLVSPFTTTILGEKKV